MSYFISLVQNIFQATPGQQLVDIVDYSVSVTDYFVAVLVALRNIATGQIVASNTFYPLVPGTVSGKLPSKSDNFVMTNQPVYLQIELYEITVAGTTVQMDVRTLQEGIAVSAPAGPSPPAPVLIVGAIAGLSLLAAAGIYLLTRKR